MAITIPKLASDHTSNFNTNFSSNSNSNGTNHYQQNGNSIEPDHDHGDRNGTGNDHVSHIALDQSPQSNDKSSTEASHKKLGDKIPIAGLDDGGPAVHPGNLTEPVIFDYQVSALAKVHALWSTGRVGVHPSIELHG
jgi:hypothetical protein